MKTRKLINVLIASLLSFALCGCGARSLSHDYGVTNAYGHYYADFYRPSRPLGSSTPGITSTEEDEPAAPVSESIESEAVETTVPVSETVAEAESDALINETVEEVEPVINPEENYIAPEEGLPGWVELNGFSIKDDMIAVATDSSLTVYGGHSNETSYPLVFFYKFDSSGNQIETIWYVIIDNAELAKTIYEDCFLPDSKYDNWGKNDGYFGDIWKLSDNVIFAVVPTDSQTRSALQDHINFMSSEHSTPVYYK